jgi:hypothetical protein
MDAPAQYTAANSLFLYRCQPLARRTPVGLGTRQAAIKTEVARDSLHRRQNQRDVLTPQIDSQLSGSLLNIITVSPSGESPVFPLLLN